VKLSIGAAAVLAAALLYFIPRGGPEAPSPGNEPVAGRTADRSPAEIAADSNEGAGMSAAEGSSGVSAEKDTKSAAREAGGRAGRRAGAIEPRGAEHEPAGAGLASEFSPDSLTDFDRRLYDYFRRSKALLVGVSNLDPAEEHAADLGTERSVSRSLLREARYLKTGPVDFRSSRLMDDLDQVMIGLANSDARSATPAVEMVRDGIETKNLLFKLRMQETRQYNSPFRQASYHR
jgi:hypothetical protein